MKTNSTRNILALTALALATASAASAQGNGGGSGTGSHGGDAVICYNQPMFASGEPVYRDRGPLKVVRMELLDFFEGSKHGERDGQTFLDVKFGPQKHYADMVRERIKEVKTYFPDLGTRLADRYSRFFSETVLLPRREIPEIDDADYVLTLDQSCVARQLAVQGGAGQKGPRYKIDRDLFFSPWLSEETRAGLVMHELLFSIGVDEFGFTNSDTIRPLNFLLSSNLSARWRGQKLKFDKLGDLLTMFRFYDAQRRRRAYVNTLLEHHHLFALKDLAVEGKRNVNLYFTMDANLRYEEWPNNQELRIPYRVSSNTYEFTGFYSGGVKTSPRGEPNDHTPWSWRATLSWIRDDEIPMFNGNVIQFDPDQEGCKLTDLVLDDGKRIRNFNGAFTRPKFEKTCRFRIRGKNWNAHAVGITYSDAALEGLDWMFYPEMRIFLLEGEHSIDVAGHAIRVVGAMDVALSRSDSGVVSFDCVARGLAKYSPASAISNSPPARRSVSRSRRVPSVSIKNSNRTKRERREPRLGVAPSELKSPPVGRPLKKLWVNWLHSFGSPASVDFPGWRNSLAPLVLRLRCFHRVAFFKRGLSTASSEELHPETLNLA